MLELTLEQLVWITKLEVQGTVKQIGKRTCKVKPANEEGLRKFVLNDGRESGQGYDCPHIEYFVHHNEVDVPEVEVEDESEDEGLELELEPEFVEPAIEDVLDEEAERFTPEWYERNVAALTSDVTDRIVVQRPEVGIDLTFEIHGASGCDVFGERDGEVFQRVMDSQYGRLVANFFQNDYTG